MSLVKAFAEQLSVSPEEFWASLKQTVLPQGTTDGEALAFLAVAHRMGLDPFQRQIYAIKGQSGNVIPVVPIDGWLKVANSHPHFDGVEFSYGPEATVQVERYDRKKGRMLANVVGPEWVEVAVYRKDRTRPFRKREWLRECARYTQPWIERPYRMLEHKAATQGIRYAFSLLGGVYDPDEAADVAHGGSSSRVAGAAQIPQAAQDVAEYVEPAAPDTTDAADTIDVQAEPVEPDHAALDRPRGESLGTAGLASLLGQDPATAAQHVPAEDPAPAAQAPVEAQTPTAQVGAMGARNTHNEGVQVGEVQDLAERCAISHQQLRSIVRSILLNTGKGEAFDALPETATGIELLDESERAALAFVLKEMAGVGSE